MACVLFSSVTKRNKNIQNLHILVQVQVPTKLTQLMGGKWRTKRSEEIDEEILIYYTGFPDSEKRNSNVTGYSLHFEED